MAGYTPDDTQGSYDTQESYDYNCTLKSPPPSNPTLYPSAPSGQPGFPTQPTQPSSASYYHDVAQDDQYQWHSTQRYISTDLLLDSAANPLLYNGSYGVPAEAPSVSTLANSAQWSGPYPTMMPADGPSYNAFRDTQMFPGQIIWPTNPSWPNGVPKGDIDPAPAQTSDTGMRSLTDTTVSTPALSSNLATAHSSQTSDASDRRFMCRESGTNCMPNGFNRGADLERHYWEFHLPDDAVARAGAFWRCDLNGCGVRYHRLRLAERLRAHMKKDHDDVVRSVSSQEFEIYIRQENDLNKERLPGVRTALRREMEARGFGWVRRMGSSASSSSRPSSSRGRRRGGQRPQIHSARLAGEHRFDLEVIVERAPRPSEFRPGPRSHGVDDLGGTSRGGLVPPSNEPDEWSADIQHPHPPHAGSSYHR